MLGSFRHTVVLLGALTSLSASAQQKPFKPGAKIDVAITYVAERAKIEAVDCGCFWLQGVGMDVAIKFYTGVGVVASLTAGRNADEKLDKVSFMLGPRYTYRPAKLFGHAGMLDRSSIFGEGLLGAVHVFNTVVPTAQGVAGAASSFVFQVGGGMDFALRKGVRLRLFEADFVRSTLPNGRNDTQDDLRLAAGISFRFKK